MWWVRFHLVSCITLMFNLPLQTGSVLTNGMVVQSRRVRIIGRCFCHLGSWEKWKSITIANVSFQICLMYFFYTTIICCWTSRKGWLWLHKIRAEGKLFNNIALYLVLNKSQCVCTGVQGGDKSTLFTVSQACAVQKRALLGEVGLIIAISHSLLCCIYTSLMKMEKAWWLKLSHRGHNC